MRARPKGVPALGTRGSERRCIYAARPRALTQYGVLPSYTHTSDWAGATAYPWMLVTYPTRQFPTPIRPPQTPGHEAARRARADADGRWPVAGAGRRDAVWADSYTVVYSNFILNTSLWAVKVPPCIHISTYCTLCKEAV